MELPPGVSTFLLEGTDPSVRYRTLTQLLGRSDDDPEVRAARAEIGATGWAADILAGQQREGHWETSRGEGRDLYIPKYIATNWRVQVLADLGMPGADPRIARAVDLFYRLWDGPDGSFGGSDSETCVTGNLARFLIRFGHAGDPRVGRAIDWLVRTQKPDGGWHCFEGMTEGTLDCWEALAAFAALPAAERTPSVSRSIERGAEFYLSRGILTESDGSSYRPWHRLHYPIHYYYDLLVGLDCLTSLGYGADPRLAPALEELESKRRPDGTWMLEGVHPDLEPDDSYNPVRRPLYPFLLELPGAPSRWITLTALRVLHRADRL